MVDSNLLKTIRIFHKMRSQDMAEQLGISRQNYSQKENNHLQFKLDEIQKIAKILRLTKDEIYKIFMIDIENNEIERGNE